MPNPNFDDLPPDTQQAIHDLNRAIGRLLWEKEGAIADERFEEAAALHAEIRELELHKQAPCGCHIDDRIKSASRPQRDIERRRDDA